MMEQKCLPPRFQIQAGLRYSLPRSVRFLEETRFEPEVEEISPVFCETYRPAHIAEANGLSEICGAGYRRALEFLIKDFLIKHVYEKDITEQDSVRKKFIGKCINGHIPEGRIKEVAKRAAWLGNDETHYYRVWSDKDVSDLKALISMTASWISLVLESDRYVKDMPE